MSSPVVAVPPDMRLKEVADLLVREGISAVPVVDDGELSASGPRPTWSPRQAG
jgi:CBS domain-containing protein